ncbi:unnamed protein product [Spirodela intermedia]|uniref:Uncharacterized protein n=1 Tax=Spirodela intermedia TaxID=51605 RepID=A0A7I8IG89_SPIIN|nr:unnamed protein product [Spirodela intermedia]CAA6656093.1 unnamed protein product [Spirodela intermedia]
MLQVLCRCRNLSAATDFLFSLDSKTTTNDSGDARILHDRFFNALIRAHARSGEIRESINLFRRMRDEFGISPSVFSFNSLLSVLLRRGWTHSARKLFDEMVQRDVAGAAVTPDVCTFNILIRGYFLNSMVDDGFRLFKEMDRWGCKPDVLTYNALLDGLCRAGKTRIAHNLLDGMRMKSPEIHPTVVSYTIVIRGYCGMRCIAEAVELFREMTCSGVKPSSITYNTLVQGLCEARRMDLIKEVMEQEEWAAFKPDTCTFNTLITAYCNMGCIKEALEVFAKMKGMKAKPDSATYSVLIRALCQSEDFHRAEALVDELLEKEVLMRRVAGCCAPLMAAYNPIFDYLCRNGRASKAGTVFRQLLAKGTVDVASCKILILGHCREGALRDAHEIVAEMVRRELKPDEDTYEALIDGFLKRGDVGFARKTLEKMHGSGHRPKTSTFHSVLSGVLGSGGGGLLEGACDLLTTMLERKIRPSLDLSTALVSGLFRADLSAKAFEVLGLLYDSGYRVKMEELMASLCDSQKLPEARDLLLFCLKQPQQKVDAQVCGKVTMGLCQAGRASDAFGLFQELTEREVGLSTGILKDLEAALEAQGKLKQAHFVSKRRMREESAGGGQD